MKNAAYGTRYMYFIPPHLLTNGWIWRMDGIRSN